MGPGFESLKVHQWPIGQVVKTAASHAVNIGSNPVWVTKVNKLLRRLITEIRNKAALNRKGNNSSNIEFVLIAMRVHLFPSRTQKLSSSALTILGGRLPGKISNANTKAATKVAAFNLYIPNDGWNSPPDCSYAVTIHCPAWKNK